MGVKGNEWLAGLWLAGLAAMLPACSEQPGRAAGAEDPSVRAGTPNPQDDGATAAFVSAVELLDRARAATGTQERLELCDRVLREVASLARRYPRSQLALDAAGGKDALAEPRAEAQRLREDARVLLAIGEAEVKDSVRFRPSRHLAGFDECSESEHSRLHDFAPFEDQEGGRVTVARLGELLTLWEDERKRVQARRDELQRDPRARFLHELERRLARESFFRWEDCATDASYWPVVLVIQLPDKHKLAVQRRVQQFYGPWAKALVDLFEAEYAKPLGLQRRAGHEGLALVVLETEGQYTDYKRSMRTWGPYGDRAHYDRRRRLCVTHEARIQGEREDDRRHAALHELVHALLEAHVAPGASLPQASWWNEGMAEYLANHSTFRVGKDGDPDPGRSFRQFDDRALRDLANLRANRRWRDVCIAPLQDLLAVKDYGEILSSAQKRSAAVGGRVPQRHVTSAFYRQSSLLTWFLHEGAGGRYRAPMRRFLGATLTGGDPGPDGFAKAFKGIELAAVSRAFDSFLDERIQERFSQPNASTARAEGGEAQAATPAPAEKAPPAMTEEASVTPGYVTALRVDTGREDEVMAWALQLAADGRLGEAVRWLRQQARSNAADPEHPVAREVDRLARLGEARLEFLASMRERQPAARLKLTVDGRTIRGTVEAVGTESFTLRTAHGETETLALHALGPLQLVRATAEHRLRIGDEETRLYARLLGGARVSRKQLQDADEAGARLEQDRDRILAGLRAGRALSEMARLAEQLPAQGIEEARTVREHVSGLFDARRGEEVLSRREDALKEAVASALAMVFDADNWDLLQLNGEVESLGQGRGRLTYRFRSTQELADFQSAEYLNEKFRVHGPLLRPEPTFRLEADALVLSGPVCVRLPFTLAGAQRVEYEITWRSVEPDPPGPYAALMGMCDDGNESFLSCWGTDRLIAEHKGGFSESMPSKEGVFFTDKRYRVVVEHDGKERVTLTLDETPLGSIACGPLVEGGMFFRSHSNLTVAIGRLVVEGRLGEATKQAWIADQLAAL